MNRRILAGPSLAGGAESLDAHRERLGPLPGRMDSRELIATLERSGLLGRGGAGFPVGRKWASVASRAEGQAVVLANGAEGEPLSAKDRILMATRPHLVLDGIELAAAAVGAHRIVVYVGSEHQDAKRAMSRAVAERRNARRGRRTAAGPGVGSGAGSAIPMRLIAAPVGYASGEESAAVHFVNEGDARPVTVPPRPYERGVAGRPTLVQNVESLANAALIARFGDAWYREAGLGETKGTALITVTGAPQSGLTEIELGTTIGEVARLCGIESPRPVMLGGYFGGWLAGEAAWPMALDPVSLRAAGSAFGAGVVSFLEPGACGVVTTARVMDFMAGSSAAQCGPCVFGLRAIADASARVARGRGRQDDTRRIVGWIESIAGRGACRLPDGTIGFMASALRVFRDEFDSHQNHRRCTAPHGEGRAA